MESQPFTAGKPSRWFDVGMAASAAVAVFAGFAPSLY
jgi:hypothetical protein